MSSKAKLRSQLNTIRWIVNVIYGLLVFAIKKKTPEKSYYSMINLHCNTNGMATTLLAKLFSLISPVEKPVETQGILGYLSSHDSQKIVQEIKENGYHLFRNKLSLETCTQLEEISYKIPARLDLYDREGKHEHAVFDPKTPISKRYCMPENELVKFEIAQQLMSDKGIYHIAAQYLKTQPKLYSVDMWWSTALDDRPDADAAQMFHFDMPGANWLNFFIYLTDVDLNSGPHCVVQKSHHFNNKKGSELLKRGYVRISDQDIEEAYGKNNIIELCGKRGTIMAVDTKCFHKGKVPVKNHRLIFQLVFTSCLFGSHYSVVKKPSFITQELQAAFINNPEAYLRYQ